MALLPEPQDSTGETAWPAPGEPVIEATSRDDPLRFLAAPPVGQVTQEYNAPVVSFEQHPTGLIDLLFPSDASTYFLGHHHDEFFFSSETGKHMHQNQLRRATLVLAALVGAAAGSVHAAPAAIKPALDGETIGLLPSDGFELRTGKCDNCPVPKQNLWYFENELIATPRVAATVAGRSAGIDRNRDVSAWAATSQARELAHPSVVWIGAPSILEGTFVAADAKRLRTQDGNEVDVQLVPKLSTNRSFANADTAAYFAGRQVRMRGTLDTTGGQERFVARTIWPSDFAFSPTKLSSKPLREPAELVKFVREPSKPGSAMETRLLWERHPGQARDWQQKPVMALMLNGAQGDDDESLGGHFAVATGHMGKQGDWSGWAVNNFYNLGSVSEKGIIAATVPMDNYLMDLNSGQQYYRPSYMLVAVLSDPRTAVAYQGGVQRVFNHFYRHDFEYRHTSANCTGISVDVLTALGWHIPQRGPTAPLKSLAAYAYVSATDRSLVGGRKIYDYLNEEQTRLLPAVAFEAAGLHLLELVGSMGTPQRALTPYEQQLRSDIEALMLVRIPQVPSSRAAGSPPVFSFDEFRSRVPENRADWKIVPAAERQFPASLRDEGFVEDKAPSPVPLPIAGIGAGTLLGSVLLWRRRQKRNVATAGVNLTPAMD